MAANMFDEQGDTVAIRVLVDKKKNKVVYAEAGNEFVDALFNFLTLPLGIIVMFMVEDTANIEAVKFGSLSSLYQSLNDLYEHYLLIPTCREMLLQQMETFPENDFVVESATFIISDDLRVMPNDIGTTVSLLRMHGNNDTESMEIKTILISMAEFFDLLKLSLLTKTPLTDFIFKKKQFPSNSNQAEFGIRKVDSTEVSRKMDLKLMLRKSTGEILFGEAKEDFADFLFSFLTFPLGGVLRMLECLTSLGCIDNLYKSMTELNADSYFRSQELKDKLALIQIPEPFQIRDQILPMGVEPLPNAFKLYDLVDPKSPAGYCCGGYARRPLKYMVTDDLVVTPMSSIDIFSSLQMMKVPLNDLEEKVIPIGVNEGLSILKASLTSTSALRNGLNQYITKALLCKKDQQEILEVEEATRKLSLLEHEKRLEESESVKEGHNIGQQTQQNLVATEKGSSGSNENLRAHGKEREPGCLPQESDHMRAVKSTLFKPDLTGQFDRFKHEPLKMYSVQSTRKTNLKNKAGKKRSKTIKIDENRWSNGY